MGSCPDTDIDSTYLGIQAIITLISLENQDIHLEEVTSF